jgi:hypothetical protein
MLVHALADGGATVQGWTARVQTPCLPGFVAFKCVFHNGRRLYIRRCLRLQLFILLTTHAQQGRLLSGA